MTIIGLMAADPQGLIGKDNALPWNYPDELEHVRKIAKGQVLVMGHTTFKSTPASFLKNCFSIVFSRHAPDKREDVDCTFVSSLDEFFTLAIQKKYEKIYMFGGAEMAHLFLENNLMSEFILTVIHKSYEGDVHLDLKRLETWSRTIMTETKDYTIYTYKNPKAVHLTNQK
jgi:dihydrofolate reductase